MTPVTDPQILAQLNGQPVTDPALLAQLNAGQPQPPSVLERIGHGMNQVVAGVKQRYLMATDPTAAEAYTQQNNADEALYQRGMDALHANEGGPDWQAFARAHPDWANALRGGGDLASEAGQAVMLTPTMLAPGGPVVGGALQGATAGFLTPTKTPSWMDVAANTAKGGAFGAVAGALAGPASPAKPAAALPPEMQARVDAMKAVGVDNPPLPAVTRSPQDWYNMVELGKKEGKPKDLYVAAQQNVNDALSNVLPSMRGSDLTPYGAAESAREAVHNFSQQSQDQVAAMYDAARNAAGATTEVPMQPIADRLGKVIEDYGVENVPAAVVSRAQQYGLLGGNQTRSFTVTDAEQFRRFLGNNINPANRPQMAALKQLQGSVDEAVSALPPADAEAGQAFQAARAAAADRFSALRPQPVARLANTEEANPSFFQNLFQSGKPGDIAALKDVLQSSPQAAEAMRSSMLDYLQGSATRAANGRFSGAELGRAMDRIGPERLKAVLSPQDLAQLNNLRTASNALTVTPDLAGVNTSNTGSTIGNMLQKLHVAPMLGAAVGGAVGHLSGIPAAPEMIGAGIGALGEAYARGNAARQMQQMVNPDLAALARAQQPQSSLIARLLMQQRTPLQRVLPMLGY